MNSLALKNIIQFFVLVLLQVLVLNNINLFGYLNPMVYIVFIFYYPIRKETSIVLFLSFLLGLFIDIFSNSGGINAAATLLIAFIRLPILKRILNKVDYDFQSFSIRSLNFGKSLSYMFSLTFIHHLVVFSLDYFSFNDFGTIITKTIYTSIFTTATILIGIVVFTKKE